jgi:uncharacterized LabA/DUF88 family protein
MSPVAASPGYVPRPWMLFVDGENITIRAQEHAEKNNRVLPSTASVYLKDVYFWPADIFGDPARVAQFYPNLQDFGRRSCYYTSARGSDEKLDEIRHALRDVGFRPTVFKRTGSRGAKGVDISLATDMLSNAYRNNFEVAILASGDGDFLPVVEEVQRLGKALYLLSVGDKVSPGLILASDRNLDLGARVLQYCDQATASSLNKA